MAITSLLGELMVDQILRYYQIELDIYDRAFIHMGGWLVGWLVFIAYQPLSVI